MQAILKSKHLRFCVWLQGTLTKLVIDDKQLNELENEMHQYYETYQQKREELRRIVFLYEEKQKGIKNRINEYKKAEYKIRYRAGMIQKEQIG